MILVSKKILFNVKILGDKCCHYNNGPLYLYIFRAEKIPPSMYINYEKSCKKETLQLTEGQCLIICRLKADWMLLVDFLPFLASIMQNYLFKYIENFTSKNWRFLTFIIFLLKNIDCGYLLELPQWGSSNKYPQSLFLSRNKKNKLYPCKPQFFYIKVGFKGVKII